MVIAIRVNHERINGRNKVTQQNFEPIEIHLKRLEVTRNAWTNVIVRAQKDINYHGNVVSALNGKTKSAAEIIQEEASWAEIVRANKRTQQAERRLEEIALEEKELIELSSISNVKEFFKQVNNSADDFNWIEEGYHYIYCNRCGESEQIIYKAEFIGEHSKCK
jgi:hypothetical protein